jgi:hypothetical protein
MTFLSTGLLVTDLWALYTVRRFQQQRTTTQILYARNDPPPTHPFSPQTPPQQNNLLWPVSK